MNQNKRISRFSFAICVVGTVIFGPMTVYADAPLLEEVFVTAQRRVQSVNDVPVAITALSGNVLRDSGVSDIDELTYVFPNAGFASFFPSRPEISIRGLGTSESFLSTDQQPVGVYHDEVFEGSRSVHMAQIFDLERVEIARGPQGILFGRNTTGGAISFYSKRPEDTLGGYVRASYGNFNAKEFEGALNVPLTDKLAARVSGIYKEDDGWAENVNLDNDIMDSESYAARALLEYTGDDSTWVLNLHGSDYEGDVNYYFSEDIQGLDWDEVSQRLDEAPENIEAFGAILTGNVTMGKVDITTITAYEESETSSIEDYGHGPTDLNNAGGFAQFNPWVGGYSDDYEQYSQEIRIAGGTNKFIWVAGVFGYYEDVRSTFSDGGGVGTIGLDFNGNGVIDEPNEGFFLEDDARIWRQRTREGAVFAHANYEISEQLSVLGGVRFSITDKELEWQYTDLFSGFDYVPKAYRDTNNDVVTWRAGVEYRPNFDSFDTMLYFRYDRGFKGSGFNVGGSDIGVLLVVDPEKVDSFEIGGKFTLLDQRLQINAAAFYTIVKDYQANLQISTPSGGLAFARTNAAELETKGGEVELNFRPDDQWLISGTVGYTDATYSEYFNSITLEDFTGNKASNTPEVTAGFSIEYFHTFSGGATLVPRIGYSYKDEQEGRAFNFPEERTASRQVVNAQIKYSPASEQFYVSLWSKNLFDEKYYDKKLDEPFAGAPMQKRGMPRSFGVAIGSEW